MAFCAVVATGDVAPASPLQGWKPRKARDAGDRGWVRREASFLAKSFFLKHLGTTVRPRISGLYPEGGYGQNTASKPELFWSTVWGESTWPARAAAAGSRRTIFHSKGVLQVTKSQLLAATAGCLLVLGLTRAGTAQTQARTALGTSAKIAVIDVNYILENHTVLKARMEDLKAEMERDAQLRKAENDTIRKMITEIQTLESGSQAYKNMEEEIARRRADLEIRARIKNKESLTKQAKIYHDVYQDIVQEVNYYASQPQNNIALVLNFDGESVDKEQPDSILRELQKQVVWYPEELDITPIILERLNLRAGTANRSSSQPQPSPPRRAGVPAPTYQR